MNAIKIILYNMLGTLLAIIISYYLYYNLIKLNNDELTKNTEIQNKNSEVYNELQPPKINVTIKNGSDNQLTCGNYEEHKYNAFLSLNGREERNYKDINEGEFIGCSFRIDNNSSTILTWFHLVSKCTYTLLFEQVECKACKGTNHSWATIVVNPNGQREYRQM